MSSLNYICIVDLGLENAFSKCLEDIIEKFKVFIGGIKYGISKTLYHSSTTSHCMVAVKKGQQYQSYKYARRHIRGSNKQHAVARLSDCANYLIF